MLRHFSFSLVALALVAGIALAADKAKGKAVSGAFASYKDGTLTLKVTSKKGEEPKAQDFKVADDTKVTIIDGSNKKEGTAKDAFKDVKEGTPVTVTLSEDDKIAAIQVGNVVKAKVKTISGAFVSDKDGTLTIKVKGKKGEEPKAQDFKVVDDTKVTVVNGGKKKEGAAKDAFKDVKEGTLVTITFSMDDKITGIQVGNLDKAKIVSGAFASYKDGTLTVKVKGKKGDEPKAQDFKVADDIKVTTYAGADKKEGTPKDAFKDVNDGTPVTITFGEGDKIAAVQVGNPPKKKGTN